MESKPHELIPSARRLITSLRDMGYDFAAAVADVVDNSIEAHARHVDIDVHFEGDESWVRITDDGIGMRPSQVREALRYGSERDYDERNALGRFGLGLKTASMSQCQRLTVGSRSSASKAEVSAFCWDMDHVFESNRWEILEVKGGPHWSVVRAPLLKHAGTVVLWERLDRMLGYQHPYGEPAKKQLSGMCRDLEHHLGMVFHRFISGDAGRFRVKLRLNGNDIRVWDPFVRSERHTLRLDPVKLAYDHEGLRGDIVLEPFVLPHQDNFSSVEAHSAAGGPRKWNRQQGFYIYRANRMIQSGGWSNLRTLDEHTKLARVAVSFDPCLDEAFRINVAKMRVQLPQLLRDGFDRAIAPVLRAAQTAYRRSGEADKNRQGSSAKDRGTLSARAGLRADSSHDSQSSALTHPREQLWTFAQIRSKAHRVATSKEKPIVRAVFDRLQRKLKDG